MGLSIIGVGFGRTGTTSLNMALEQLGFGPCHQMEEVFSNPQQLPKWETAVAGRSVDWDDVYAGYNSTVDWPGALFWEELADTYPAAKIILTTRPTESWWHSFSNTIMKAWEIIPEMPKGHPRNVALLGKYVVLDKTFGGTIEKQAVTSIYDGHIQKVLSSFTGDRLLQFDVRDGWAPLCKFLNKPIPDGDFPKTNNPEQFWEINNPKSS
jgi:hypothetical protein